MKLTIWVPDFLTPSLNRMLACPKGVPSWLPSALLKRDTLRSLASALLDERCVLLETTTTSKEDARYWWTRFDTVKFSAAIHMLNLGPRLHLSSKKNRSRKGPKAHLQAKERLSKLSFKDINH